MNPGIHPLGSIQGDITADIELEVTGIQGSLEAFMEKMHNGFVDVCFEGIVQMDAEGNTIEANVDGNIEANIKWNLQDNVKDGEGSNQGKKHVANRLGRRKRMCFTKLMQNLIWKDT